MGANYQSVVDLAADWTTMVDADGRYLYGSAASRRLFGWEPSDLVGKAEEDFVHPDDVAALHARRSERTWDEDLWTISYRLRCGDSSYRWVEASSRLAELSGGPVVITTVRDITARHKRTAALEEQALTDPLTGLANRTILIDRLRQGLRRLGRSGGLLAVLYLDLDRFKVINDLLGHRIGDELLVQISQRLQSHVRPADTLARLGGDEFVLVAEGVVGEAAVVALADRLVRAGRRPYRVGDEDFACTMSIGIAFTADDQRRAEDLLSEADLALYRAKDEGRDQVALFDEELRTTAVGRLVTERTVRRALNDGRIVVEYEPIVDLRTGRAVGTEALARIRDAEKELWLSTSLLDVAYETGLTTSIDEVVLADAVRQAAAWRGSLDGTAFEGVAINVTARRLADSGFRQTVLDRLHAHDVPPQALRIEVTERALIEASSSALSGLRAWRDVGLQVGLDDFGTGYSSLAYLRQFPLDFLKIDKSLIDDIERVPKERAMLAAIIELAHALSLTVTAEGVETRSQAQLLADLGCDRGQGFLFGVPGPPEAIGEIVLGGPRIDLRH